MYYSPLRRWLRGQYHFAENRKWLKCLMKYRNNTMKYMSVIWSVDDCHWNCKRWMNCSYVVHLEVPQLLQTLTHKCKWNAWPIILIQTHTHWRLCFQVTKASCIMTLRHVNCFFLLETLFILLSISSALKHFFKSQGMLLKSVWRSLWGAGGRTPFPTASSGCWHQNNLLVMCKDLTG